MHVRTLCSAAVAAALVACAAAKPRTYGAYNELTPRVSAKAGERTPQHLTVELSRAANVAVFLVVPGRGSQLLFPADSTQSPRIEAGSHEVTTSLARLALADSSRLARRPNQNPPAGGQRPAQGRAGRGAFDPSGGSILNQHGYLLVYASQDSLPYTALSTRVSGISIPIDDADALNTVTKLIRETTRTTGTWAAYAAEFSP